MKFFKYHGLGNDFVLLDRRDNDEDITQSEAVCLCDRHLGVGSDGVLVLLPSAKAWARMVVHNADGSVPEMCGNGIRCAVKYLVDHSGQKPESIPVETDAGTLVCRVAYEREKVSEVEVSMGPARFHDHHLPSTPGVPFVRQEVSGFPGVLGTAVSMGNPHLVLFEQANLEVATLGPRLERAAGFPERTNVEFAQLVEGGVDVVVWERGCGLTQACGTGACATVAAGVLEQRLNPGVWVDVRLPGGHVQVRVEPDFSQVFLRGPATFVYEGILPD